MTPRANICTQEIASTAPRMIDCMWPLALPSWSQSRVHGIHATIAPTASTAASVQKNFSGV